ncbi:Response regulator of zinc sigma-54-dependent two-component system [hydrothermal vent metagenome]|uniref:Response regulator of zinc sigma-54-dependent two-component system n=1 Tax=hydrothermal vent metagenome TaxID=652676 RepID=A0A3B1CJ66_9ZZZZ
MSFKIFIAEDEEITLKHLMYALKNEGYTVSGAKDGLEAWQKIQKEHFDIVITDIKMPGLDGLSLLEGIKEKGMETDVIVITGFGSIDSAVEAMKKGAYDYITKPFNLDELLLRVRKICEKKSLEKENIALKTSLGINKDLPTFIAKSKKMKEVINIIRSITASDCNVIITGESGVGKGLVAKLIHYTGTRANRPFLAINCAIFTEELLASELFGHERGAFTGAVTTKKGLLEIADTGTLFLDEIAEMSPSLQAKLLKIIEDREFFRVGGTRPIRVDVRFIAATNQDINGLVTKGTFRKDLFYRLNVMDIYIPPLRERKEDILPLGKYFLEKHSKKAKKDIKGFARETTEILKSYSYPGNVRELENIIERAVILEQSSLIQPENLPVTMQMFQIETIDPGRLKTIDELNREYALKILDHLEGNKTRAAKMLGISRTSLWRILREKE